MRLRIISAALLTVSLTTTLAACSANEAEPSAARTTTATDARTTTATEVTLDKAPDVTGVPLDKARATLEEAGYTVKAHDSVESRNIIVEGNWVVTDQTVTGSTVSLGAKKSTDPTDEEKAAKAEADASAKAAADKAAAEKAAYDALPIGQRNAISKAKDYLGYSAFSRAGLIEQLEFEGFSKADATFAVDYVAPDWNAQAAAKAKEYLAYSSFSRQGLIDQLMFEGFSAEQAAHGAAAAGY